MPNQVKIPLLFSVDTHQYIQKDSVSSVVGFIAIHLIPNYVNREFGLMATLVQLETLNNSEPREWWIIDLLWTSSVNLLAANHHLTIIYAKADIFRPYHQTKSRADCSNFGFQWLLVQQFFLNVMIRWKRLNYVARSWYCSNLFKFRL